MLLIVMNYQITAKNQINKYISLLRQEGLIVSEAEEGNYCFESNIRNTSEKLKIMVYFGIKGVKTVIQGNKSGNLFKMTEEIIFGKKFFEFSNVEITEPEEYIGTDESGKGDYFGPLVIAAVLVDKEISSELKSLGVRDSKLLSGSAVSKLSVSIKKITGDKWAVVFISPQKYNELYSRFGNLNRLLAWGHSRAMENILSKHDAGTAISDKFGDESLIKNTLFEKGKKINLYQYNKAEKYTAVAAASILARNELNRWFILQEKKLNVTIPKGASDAVDKAAGELLKQYGWDKLKEIVKEHFKTTKKILNQV